MSETDVPFDDGQDRCTWACGKTVNQAYRDYHDMEWGVPVRDDQRLFEFIVLEGAQAGLSWRTVLDKRENYRRAFHGFEIERVAAMKDRELESLLSDPGLIRNRLKIYSARNNARLALDLVREHGGFDAWIWNFAGGKPLVNHWKTQAEVPSKSTVSDHMSKAMHARGFRFIGSTICYAFMQATGMVNDHLLGCFRHPRNLDNARRVVR